MILASGNPFSPLSSWQRVRNLGVPPGTHRYPIALSQLWGGFFSLGPCTWHHDRSKRTYRWESGLLVACNHLEGLIGRADADGRLMVGPIPLGLPVCLAVFCGWRPNWDGRRRADGLGYCIGCPQLICECQQHNAFQMGAPGDTGHRGG